jgi:transcriptional regulator with XRE-family HTH domain
MDTFDFRAWLQAQRARRNWKKSEVARRAGLSQGYVNNLETGEREPTDEALRSLAAAFEVDPDWLIAKVDTARIGPERIERIRQHVPEFLGLPRKRADRAKEPPPPRYVVPRVAAGEGLRSFEPDRIEHDEVDRPFDEET